MQWRHLHPATTVPTLSLSLCLGARVLRNVTDVDNATPATRQIRVVIFANSNKPECQGHRLLTADTVSLFDRQHIVPAAVDVKVRAVLVVKFLVHVGHDLSRLSECTDHLILPLVDQHQVLQDNTRVSVITQAGNVETQRKTE